MIDAGGLPRRIGGSHNRSRKRQAGSVNQSARVSSSIPLRPCTRFPTPASSGADKSNPWTLSAQGSGRRHVSDCSKMVFVPADLAWIKKHSPNSCTSTSTSTNTTTFWLFFALPVPKRALNDGSLFHTGESLTADGSPRSPHRNSSRCMGFRMAQDPRI